MEDRKSLVQVTQARSVLSLSTFYSQDQITHYLVARQHSQLLIIQSIQHLAASIKHSCTSLMTRQFVVTSLGS